MVADVQIQIDPAAFCGIASAATETNAAGGASGEGAELDSAIEVTTPKTTKESFDEHFICGICQMVVLDAEECGKC